MSTGANVKNWGVFGWTYNRANYKYDQTLRWNRFTSGRKQAMSQVDMFREDIADLAGVSSTKLKVYGPIYGIVVTVCVTVFVEGRSGLKFPGPPVFISGIYLQCLCIGMSFIILAAWLLFHAAMRAQIACVQLRTRIVRVPVPTQRQLDGSRKLLSTWEEQGVYDMLRIPFVMPNGAGSPEESEEEVEGDESPDKKGYNKGGLPGVAHQIKNKVKDAHAKGETTHSAKAPGFTPGHPGWYEKELTDRDALPHSSPSGFGNNGPDQPYQHFELLRQSQKEWWGCEAYMRVAFLYGMVHLVMAFSYWITLHNIAELGMIWCSNLGAAGLTAGVWIIFRMDVLPEQGGFFPIELGGPFVTSIALGMMYSHQITETMMNIARIVAITIVIMHILMCYRMYAIAKPMNARAHHGALEVGGRLFNQSGSCDHPAWLPTAFQHVMYLVAPPKTKEQMAKEAEDRDNKAIADEALANVDMTPWQYVRTMILVVAIAWSVQLTGRIVECGMGERMLVSNPGQPPWTRTGQWYGWEHGPISSKHYAHVTPQRGHWAWQKGWGPQGQQELWASDMFGFHPEADMFWAEPDGPEPRVGAAGLGPNTWNHGVLAYGQGDVEWGKLEKHESMHDWEESGGHRRLSDEAELPLPSARPVVPVPVQWPTSSFEPDHLICGPRGGSHAAITASGLGALIPADGAETHDAKPFHLSGLLELGMVRGATWGADGLTIVAGTGVVAHCPVTEASASATCSRIMVPELPQAGVEVSSSPAAVVKVDDKTMLAAMAEGDVIAIMRWNQVSDSTWKRMDLVHLPHRSMVKAVSLTATQLLVTDDAGVVYKWTLRNGIPTTKSPAQNVPVAGSRTWMSACALHDGRIMRLASTSHKTKGSVVSGVELLV